MKEKCAAFDSLQAEHQLLLSTKQAADELAAVQKERIEKALERELHHQNEEASLNDLVKSLQRQHTEEVTSLQATITSLTADNRSLKTAIADNR